MTIIRARVQLEHIEHTSPEHENLHKHSNKSEGHLQNIISESNLDMDVVASGRPWSWSPGISLFGAAVVIAITGGAQE